MRFKPEQHLEMARRLEERTRRERDPKKAKRLAALAPAHRMRAEQIAKASKPPSVAKTSQCVGDNRRPDADLCECLVQYLAKL